MTQDTDPLAAERAAWTSARKAATDAVLDLKLVNDRPAADLSHPFRVLEEMLHVMDAEVSAIHALDRLVARAEQLGGLVEGSALRAEGRSRGAGGRVREDPPPRNRGPE